MNPHGVDVFISSTCYDLTDVRAELRRHLEDNAFIVRLSDDYDSAFKIEPTEDSIRSCLNNVDHADAVICIIDRRYGPPLPSGEFKDKSATHAEVLYAESLRKPVFIFIRDKAFQEYGQLRRNPHFDSKWVDDKTKAQWTDFVKSRVELQDREGTNWRDEFATSVDLKAKVLKRLLDQFPQQTGALALRPDRLVRLYFIFRSRERTGIGGHFQNGGVGPALNLKVGFDLRTNGQDVEPLVTLTQGGLAEKEFFRSKDLDGGYRFELTEHYSIIAKALFCEYENRYGDRYKVLVPLDRKEDSLVIAGEEQFFVAPKGPSQPEWIQIR
jgi:nucleoside 2-deoxyribosyltransferase